MSLDWNLAKCSNKKQLQSKERWETTRSIIFLCMALGMRGIDNEEQTKEWFFRFRFYDSLYGPVFTWGTLTLDEVKECIGLTTNVTPERRPSWSKRMTERFFADEAFKLLRASKDANTSKPKRSGKKD